MIKFYSMLTKLIVRNFKLFEEIEVELGDPVLFIGPNNSGKTTALQALALWGLGVKRWNEKRKGAGKASKQKGVTINRRDILSIPVPVANLFWRNLHVRRGTQVAGKPGMKNIRIDIIVEGVIREKSWECGLEFDYGNEESIYCRPLRLSDDKDSRQMPMPPEAGSVEIAFLPPMSGLAANEDRLEPGSINVRIGEGRTAEVLRNLCSSVCIKDDEDELIEDRPSDIRRWDKIVGHIETLFNCKLDVPQHVPERGEITLAYHEGESKLDISCSGRGLQQTVLLLAYMYTNPGSVVLLDEPDAHLEILRQRQVYQRITDVARENRNQIIAASHSEVLLNEAAGRDVVVAFVGKPHRINDRGGQVYKALKEIGWQDYYQAEQTGWVLYLEGSTDLAILRAFAKALGHQEAMRKLERPFVDYKGNQPKEVLKHFHGLREGIPGLLGIAIFDKLDQELPEDSRKTQGLEVLQWTRREIESYICFPETLEAYAASSTAPDHNGPLFESAESEGRKEAMRESIREIEKALDILDKGSPWDFDLKVTDEFLDPLFVKYFKKLDLPNLMRKTNYHELVPYVPREKIDPEVKEKLDAIVDVAGRAKPRE